jgi:hypothetical protein
LQQSVATPQELPGPLQVVTDDAQVLATGSHDCEQHWAFDVQVAPATVQITPAPPVAPAPPWPPEAAEPPLPVVTAFTESLPQLGSASSATSNNAKMAMMDTFVGEGLMGG